MNEEYLVYVSCITFNQSFYIKETLDGFCIQETNFPYVCGIIDDASTDGEQEIIGQYLRDNFDLENRSITRREENEDYVRVFAQHKLNKNCFFVVVYLKHNHYLIKRSKLPYVAEWRNNARYTAICEGDDYWISKNKLQKQYDFLEGHSQCGLVYSRAKVFSEDSGRFAGDVGEKCDSFSELLLKNSIPTLTVMFRTDIYHAYYDNIVPSKRGWKMGDYPLWLYISANREIHFIDETTSVYRVNKGSASRPASYKAKLDYLDSSKKVRMFFCELYNRKDQFKAIERYYEESCVMASVEYKKIKEGLCIIFTSKYLSLPRRMILLGRLIKAKYFNS